MSIYKNSPFKDAVINEHLFILRSKKKFLIQEFLFYLLQSQNIFHKISLFISGSAQPGLNRNFTKKIYLEIPSVDEQKKTTNTLNHLSNHLKHLDILIKKFKNLKSSVVNHIYSFGLKTGYLISNLE